MFACPRDNGANVLRLSFREGTLSKLERNAYHAFTECRFYIAPTPASTRAYRIGRNRQRPAGWVYFPKHAVIPRRRPMSLTLHLPMGGDRSSHSAKRNPMQIPVWLKPGLWGAASGAVAMAIVGFSQLGWKTEGTAEQLAQDRADTAVISALVPFCVAKAQTETQQAALASFQAEQSSYSRSDLVVKAGWATLGIAKSPDNSLARACSAKLYGMKTSG